MIAIINTGCANINSVKYAFERINTEVEVITQPELLTQFDKAILPGVGHAKVAMDRLSKQGWDQAIKEYQRPLLGICLGMQLLFESTDEGEIEGLGVLDGKVTSLNTHGLSSPHMGWNTLSSLKTHPLTAGLCEEEQVYFVHSFAHKLSESTLISANYGEEFSAVVQKDNFAGMQFHPERSAKVGSRLLNNFINWKI